MIFRFFKAEGASSLRIDTLTVAPNAALYVAALALAQLNATNEMPVMRSCRRFGERTGSEQRVVT